MRLLVVLVALLVSASPAFAQLPLAKDNPVVYGHHHINASNIDEAKKFWADTLGGTAMTFGPQKAEVVKFPHVFLFMRAQAPKGGGSKGTSLNHVGFSVPDVQVMVDRVKAGGYKVVTREEAAPNQQVVGDLALLGGGVRIAFVMAPDDVKVEFVEARQQKEPIALHHLHFFTHQPAEMRAWYEKVFGAAARPAAPNAAFISATLPGLLMNFTQVAEPTAATAGRSFDHIGFEIKNLEEFCKRLQAQGIALNVPYRYVDSFKLGLALLTDPWGTNIELNEGLDKVE